MEFLSQPPQYRRYSITSGRHGPAPLSVSSSHQHELPAYSRRSTLAQPATRPREPTEHVYPLVEGRGKPWAVLKVYSSAKSSKSLPTFFEKENVNGSLELNVERGESIQAVTATITGRIITGANADDSLTFLNQILPIWSKSPDVPRLPTTSPGAAGAKLNGQCVWPLSIAIPRTVNLPIGGGQTQSFRLPETFLERHTRASVQYDLTINIARGKLRTDSHIKTAFGYVPGGRPNAPSMLRQLAYQQGCPLPGPHVDPEGWKTLRPAPIRGTLFKSRNVEARCTLSLANPLCYTRGTVLPCHISLESQDPEFLDLLSTPCSINAVLRRHVKFYNKPSHSRQHVAWNETVDDVGRAVWWPSSDGRSTTYARYLDGEVKLGKDLRPSCAIGHFSISYSLVIAPFNATGFSSPKVDLLSEPVEIATLHAKGPRPVAYSPPEYDLSGDGRNDEFYAGLHGFSGMSV